MKKALCILLAVLTLGFAAAPLSAQTVWNGTADVTWYDASQTSFDISTPEQLAGLAQLVNTGTSFNGVSLNLTNDIWLNNTGDSTNNWTPIGGGSPTSESPSTGNAFKGNFNGHGHAIYNLYCDKGNTFHAGLFCALENPCTIDSLVMVNPVLKSRGMMGCIAGYPRGSSSVYVRYCLVINARIEGVNTSGSNNIGCIFGATYPNNGSTYVENCGATGSITGYYPGGMSGNAERSYTTNFYFAGTLNSYGTNYGGVAAHGGNFTNCYSYTQVLSSTSQSSASSDGTPVTQTEMQSANMITLLGDAFKEDNGINNGYPIMSYMAGVDPVAVSICQGETVTLTAFGYDSYLWDNGATSESITVSPTTTTTYSVTGTLNGVSATHTSTVTVFPQAVITATVVPSADGQTHGTVTPETSTVPCGSSQTVTLTITPDVNWHISRIVQDGVVLREDDPTDGSVVNFTIDPQGTLANVQVYFDNLYNITVSQQLDDGSPISLSNLVSPWGTNGVYAATAGNDLTYTFTSSDRYHVTDVEIDGASQGVISSYTFYGVDQTHSILVTYADSCGIFSLPYAEDFSNGFSECWSKSSTYSSTYPYISSSRLYFYTGSSYYTLAVLPEVAEDLPYQVNELQVAFNAQYSTLSDYLQVGVMTDPADGNTFVPVENVLNTATSVMENHVVYLGNYTGTGRYIAFKWLGTAYGSCYLDDVEVDVAPTCSNVMNLQVTNIYGTNATLTWTPNAMGDAVNYVIEVTEPSDVVATEYFTTETTYMLTGLNEQTSYTVSVYPDCGGNDYGAPMTVSFTTPCIAPIEAVNNSYPTSTYSTEGNHFPMSNHYLNSFTEQIYLPSELNNVSADFSGMSFQYNDGQVITRTLDIYMAHTYDSAFVQNVWATPSDSYVHVYSGPVTFNNTGTDRWVDIAFDTNFYYNGYDNLLLIVNDITGSTVNNSNAKFYTINYSTNRSQCEYNNDADANWSITNLPATGRVKTQVDNIRLTACDVAGCIAPNTLTVGMTDASSGEIFWYNPNASSNCEIEYKAVSDADWTSTGTVNGSSYTISGLDANTQYQVRVRALCGSASTSEWSETVTFRTECDAIVTLPYVQNFDTDTYGSGTEAYIYCWDRYTTDPSKPVQMYPTSAAHSTPNAIRFYDGANVTNIAIMPKVDESINLNELQVDFYVRSTSSTAPVILELGVMTDKSDPTTFEVLDTIPAPYLPNNEYTLVEYSLANYTGYGHYIAFRASKGNGGHNLRLDDVTLNYIPMCQHPVNLAVDAVTSDAVTFHWSEVGDAFSWFVEYGPAGFTPGDGTTETSYDTTYTISGLNPNTQYDVYVWSDCGGLESTSITTTFRTDCGPIAELPFFEDFETGVYNTGMYNSSGQQDYIVCWNRYASDDAHHFYIPTGTTYSHSGSHYLDAHWTSNCFNIAIAPALDQSFDMSQLMVHFWACRTGSSGTLEVGIMDDPAADTTFFPIDTIDLSYMNTYAYDEKYVKFNTYTGTGKYVAFRVANASSCGYYIDDVTIDYAPACSPVSGLEISDISGTSAVVSWEAGFFGTVDSYTLEYSEGGQDNWTTVNNITETTYLLGGLNHSTYYDVRVKTNCSDGTNGDWVMETFRTNCLVGGDVTIGNGTSTNSYLPSYSFYNYSYTQQLFLASEMGQPKSIESVTFDIATYAATRTYKIYLMHTTATSVSSWIDASNAQLVFDASQQMQAGLNTFQFSTPFMYNGSDNLLLIVLDNTGSYQSPYNYWRTHSAFSNASRYIYQDGSAYSTSSVPASAGTGTSSRNNVIFGSPCDTTTTCVAPHLSISAITSNGATVNWVAGYMESAWEMEYRPLSDTNWISVGTVTSMAEVISGLMPNTPYKVRMRSDCGGGEYSYWTETSFTTACGAITVTQDNPWTEDFENNTTMTCFDTPVIYTNSSGNSYPKMLLNYSLAAHSGGNSLEFKGTSNMVVLPEFTNDIHDLRMSFWATTWGVTTTAVVGVITDLDDPTTFETLGDAGTPGPRGPNGSTGNGNYMGPFDFNGVQANSGRIAILFSGVTSSDAGWNLDDFTVELTPNCPSPVKTSVTVTGVTANTADVYWVDNDATHNSWTVYYKPMYADQSSWQTTVANQIPATLTGLTSSTEYQVYVITNCSVSDPVPDATQTVTFTTQVSCPAPASIFFSNVVTDGADVSWVSIGDATEWEVEYGLHGFVLGTGTTATVYTQSYTLQNLIASSQYDVYVRSVCGVGDNSAWTGPASFSTACGAISVATTPWTTDFEGTDAELLNCWVSATTGYYNGNTFPHITNASVIAHSGSSALEIAFGDIVTALPLFVENLSDLQVTFWAKTNNYSSDSPTMELGYVTDPYDANSFVSLETLSGSTYAQTTRTFADLAGQNLPSSTRIAFRYTRPTSSSLSSWYVDDMVVEYIGGSGPVVTDPTVATNAAENIMQTTATLKATITNPDGVTITAKGFQWKATTGGTYTSVTGTGTGNTFTANLTNLAPNTSYTFKAFITFNGQTVEGSEMTFTTLPEGTPEPCNTPTGLTVSEVTDMSITITWDADANVSSWNIQYSAAGGTLNSATSTTNSYTITGLTPETTYSIQVQANCGNGNLSEWTSAVTGTTTVGIDSWLAGSVTLFPNPAREVVNVQCTMNNVQLTGELSVFDVYGKLLQIVPITSEITPINVSGLANGMYFVRVTTEAGSVTKTFVKKG